MCSASRTTRLISTAIKSNNESFSWSKAIPIVIGVTSAAAFYSLKTEVDAVHMNMEPPMNRRQMTTKLLAFDSPSLRRGYEVYKQVCATCHSLEGIRYGQLVNVILLEEEAKAEAAEHEYQDGPDETGDYFMRPGKLSDPLPKPYPNKEAARFANNGSLPPNLSQILGARLPGSYYLFSLLTGYMEPPAGIVLDNGMSYNPYFPGCQIAMPSPLHEGMIEYSDGTPASISQMAKDVSHFLEWALVPRWNDDKAVELKKAIIILGMSALCFYQYKRVWGPIKSRVLRRF